MTAQDGELSHQGEITLIAVGSNLESAWGDAAATVREGMSRVVSGLGGQGVLSPLYASPAFPAGIGPDFVNAVAAVRTSLDPGIVLELLHDIEGAARRQRAARWGPRTLDLDLLAVGAAVLPDAPTQTRWRDLEPAQQKHMSPDRLILPHPRLQDRAFVLVPLADVAPDWRHPLLGCDVAELLSRLPPGAREAIRPLPG